MDASIKSLTITGSAAEDAMRPRRSVGSRKKRKTVEQEQAGGENEFIENAKRIVFGNSPQEATLPVIKAPVIKAPILTPAPIVQPQAQAQPQAQPHVQPNVEQRFQEGGKVILNPPKQQRVKLRPKLPVQVPLPNQTRKARRIHLNIANLANRFTRAKRVRDDTEKQSIDSIRAYLIQKGVIQAKSKAPEKMLRSMYSDFMLLKDQAL